MSESSVIVLATFDITAQRLIVSNFILIATMFSLLVYIVVSLLCCSKICCFKTGAEGIVQKRLVLIMFAFFSMENADQSVSLKSSKDLVRAHME